MNSTCYQIYHENDTLKMLPCEITVIPDEAWEKLESKINTESALRKLDAFTLKNRFLNNESALVLCNNEICCYLSILPFLTKDIFCQITFCETLAVPDFTIYEFCTGYTDSAFRKMGIAKFLANALIANFHNPGSLIVSGTKSKASAFGLASINWKNVVWSDYPFINYLYLYQYKEIERLFSDEHLYTGPPITINSVSYIDWCSMVLLWVTEPLKMMKYEKCLSDSMNADFDVWKSRVQKYFSKKINAEQYIGTDCILPLHTAACGK